MNNNNSPDKIENLGHQNVDLERTLPNLVGKTITLISGTTYFDKGDQLEVISVNLSRIKGGTHSVFCKYIKEGKIMQNSYEIGGGVFINTTFNSLSRENIVFLDNPSKDNDDNGKIKSMPVLIQQSNTSSIIGGVLDLFNY